MEFDVSGAKVKTQNKRTYRTSNHLFKLGKFTSLRGLDVLSAFILSVGGRSKLARAMAALNLAAIVV